MFNLGDEPEPTTPLMEAPPTPLPSARSQNFTNDERPVPGSSHARRMSKRDKIACGGVIIVAVIIALILIIVGIKSALEEPEYTSLEKKLSDAAPDSVSTTSIPITSDKDAEAFTSTAPNPPDTSTIAEVTTASATDTSTQDSADTTDGKFPDFPVVSDILPVQDDALAVDPNPVNIFDDETIEEVEDPNFSDISSEINKFDSSLEAGDDSGFTDIKSQINQFEQGSGPDPRSSEVQIPSNYSAYVATLVPPSTSFVFCDPIRELRCRDRSQCYPIAKHCDFKVDCNDYSDEDTCTCKQRLIDARLCDGYDDCMEGEDENDCNCPEHKPFFCDMEPFDKSVCIEQAKVCDGVEDCRSGRDEDGCIVNFPHTLDLHHAKPAFSHTSGLLTVKLDDGEYRHLAVRMDQHDTVAPLALRTCSGLVDFESVSYKIIEYDFDSDEVAVIDTYDESDKRFSFKKNDDIHAHIHLVHVQCKIKTCSAYSSLDKRAPAHDLPEEFYHLDASEIAKALDNGTIAMPKSTEGKIVGGSISNIEMWPSTVAIYRNAKFVCGATLINSQWIITAGHCLYKYENGDKYYSVRIGMQRKQSQSPWEQTRIVKEVYMHPDYEHTFLRHDLSLGKLDRPIMINRLAQPVCLPFNADMTPAPGQTCTAAGWGLISEKGVASEELKEVTLHVLEKCKQGYNDINNQICAGAQLGQDSCQGDSGGPLYCNNEKGEAYLGGVISHGKGCGREGQPGVYVRLSVYYPWVEQVLAGNVPKVKEPLMVCAGQICGTGECVVSSDLCDEDVDCLDNGDVQYCKVVDGKRVQVLPEDYVMNTNPNLGHVDSDPFAEKTTEGTIKEESHNHHHNEEHDNVVTEKDDEGHHTDHHETALGGTHELTTHATEIEEHTDADKHVEEGEIVGTQHGIISLTKFNMTKISCSGEEFLCSVLEECVAFDKRCDGIPDCQDKSDEIGCSCGQMLQKTNPDLVNNGFPDCQDYSDETETLCPESQYQCPGSKVCIRQDLKCDSRPDCPNGEDERNCAILVSGNIIPVSKTGEISKNSSGYLVVQKKAEWKPVCVLAFTNKLTSNLCSYMGLSGPSSFQLIPKEESPLNTLKFTSRSSRRCNHVYITCGPPKCGDRTAARQSGMTSTEVSTGPGVHPWTVSFLSDGQFVCSGSLIHPQYVITSLSCGIDILRKKGFNTVLAGQVTKSRFGWSAHTQLRKLGKFKIIQGTRVVIGNLVDEYVITDYVRHLCPGNDNVPLKGAVCQLSGKTNTAWVEGYPVEVADKCQGPDTEYYDLCSCESSNVDTTACSANRVNKVDAKDMSSWYGALACPDKGLFYYSGLTTSISDDGGTPTEFFNLVSQKMQSKVEGLLDVFDYEHKDEADDCPYRCLSGTCLQGSQLCDSSWDCADGSDESNCSFEAAWPMCTPVHGSNSCTCPKEYGKCTNNMCLPMEKYCDGVNDCLDNSDESEDCSSCIETLRFSDPSAICDGKMDCADGSDESGAVCGCPDGHFVCQKISGLHNDSAVCEPMNRLCDGRLDCASGVDEKHEMCITLSSGVDDTQIVPPESVVNGYLRVRSMGKWVKYCTPYWKDSMGDHLCSVLGFERKLLAYAQTPTDPVFDIGYHETGIKSPQCQIIYIVCKR